MHRIGRASIPYALKVLEDGDERSRCMAVDSLQYFIELKQAPPLVPILINHFEKDTNSAVRGSIAVCLGVIGPPAAAAIPVLEKAAVGDNEALANAAKTSLKRIRGLPY
jgi:HEAT repeat protein